MLSWLRASCVFLAVPLVIGGVAAACGGTSAPGSVFVDAGADGSTSDGSIGNGDANKFAPPPGDGGLNGDGGDDATGGFDVEPSTLQTVTVKLGQTVPTVVFNATYDGKPISAGWSVNRGNLASITGVASSTGVVTPTASGGGLVTVTAGLNGVTLNRQVFIQIVGTQNGANPSAPGEGAQIPGDAGALTSGGGVGGVGGEGLGQPVNDQPTLTALGSPQNSAQSVGLSLIYPYDQTVWPRGLLAPLLQWTWSPGDSGVADADAIQIQLLTTSGSFSWTGTFGRPAILAQTGGDYIRAPIPQDIWAMATETAGGTAPNGKADQLVVSLVIAKDGQGYGPVSETWTIAPGLLDGIIYYNSYGTQLALNYTGAVGGNGKFGGAVLSIHVGDTGPQLVAGSNGGAAQCRVCHSVAAGGSSLVVQQGSPSNYPNSSAYTLSPTGAVESPTLAHDAEYPGMYPDGTMALTQQGLLLPLPNDATPITISGLSTFATNLGVPAFSPDGTQVVMNPQAGPGVTGPGQQLWVMSYDNTLKQFASQTLVVDDKGQASGVRPGWASFFPDGKSIVFQHQSQAGNDGNGGALYTRKGNLSQIGWTSASDAAHVTALDALNGKTPSGGTYLPKLATPINLTCTGDGVQVGGISPDHGNDINVNYEPTANPIPTGGYVWVVFTSRRMYGSVADIPPFCSDPRGVNLITNVTPKKLWVAAVDLNAKPGADASHPAFYLPGQELLAGNSRAFWVLNPCLADGLGCTSGDQCCNGYCEQGGGDAGLVCGNKPPNSTCSPQGDKCTSSADCCNSADSCIGGFCEVSSPQSQ